MPLKLHFALLRRPLAVWLTMLIAVFGALAPTLSHALVMARGGTSAWTEVCTSTGTRWVMLGQSPSTARPTTSAASSPEPRADLGAPPISTASPDGQEAAFSLDHCPFCLLCTDHAAPPPNAWRHLFSVLDDAGAPTIRQTFFFVTQFVFTPLPRGPPAVV